MKIGDHTVYGIGWASDDSPDGYHVVWDDGGMPGVSTDLILVPSEDIAVVVLMNGEGSASSVANEIMKVMLPKWQFPAEKPEAAATLSQTAGNLLNGAMSATADGPNPVTLTKSLQVKKES